MSDIKEDFSLPSRVSQEDLQSLKTLLAANTGSDITVSAKGWRTFDSLTLQFLLSATRDWVRRGKRFTIVGLSAEMAGLFEQIGVRRDMLTWEEAQ